MNRELQQLKCDENKTGHQRIMDTKYFRCALKETRLTSLLSFSFGGIDKNDAKISASMSDAGEK